MRDDFTAEIKETLAKRVGMKCSNPSCRKPTAGPQMDPLKTINIGVAAHIKAASPGGKRYDASMSSEERKGIQNGIWLCQSCAKLVDNDEVRYRVETLVEWRRAAEAMAHSELEGRNDSGRIDTATLERLVSLRRTGDSELQTFRRLNNEIIPAMKTWISNWEDEVRKLCLHLPLTAQNRIETARNKLSPLAYSGRNAVYARLINRLTAQIEALNQVIERHG